MQKRVCAIIIRDKARLLVTGHDADFFWTPGGKIDGSDTPLETVHREIKEELGVNVCHATLFGTENTTNSLTNKKQVVSYLFVDVEGKLNPSNEITGYCWYTRENSRVGSLKITKNMREITYPKLVAAGLV